MPPRAQCFRRPAAFLLLTKLEFPDVHESKGALGNLVTGAVKEDRRRWKARELENIRRPAPLRRAVAGTHRRQAGARLPAQPPSQGGVLFP